MQPPNPAAASSTAPAPAAAPGTSRPDVATYRAMQSMQQRLNAMGSQLQQMGGILVEQQRQNDEAADKAFRDGVRARLDSGEISATDAALEVAEHVANRRAALNAQALPPAPQPPPVDVSQVQQQIGVQSILRGFGLEGSNDPSLDYSSPQALVASAQRVLAARAATAQVQGVDHDEIVAEAARRQGLVIPHRDGGRPMTPGQPITHDDVQRTAWGYNAKRNPPARLKAQIEAMRATSAGRTPSLPTGETGFAPTPENYARISGGQNPR